MSASTASRFASKLSSKTVLILGGSSGIGLGAAAAVLESGANVIISSSRESRLSESIESLKSSYPSLASNAVGGFTCDLSSPDVESNLRTLFEKVSAHLKDTLQTDHIDHLIYSAGDSLPTIPIEEISLANFTAGIQVRGPSALLTIKTFLPLLPKANTTSITLTSGSICDKPIPGGWAITSFVGSGLNGLTRQLALDLAPIRVNCVAPGVVDTNLWSSMDEKDKKGLFEQMEKTLPTGRVPSPDDIAESYLYLMRDRNVTGSTIHTNGGTFL